MLARVAGLIAAELTTTTVILTSRFSHRNSFSLTHTDTDICTQAHTGSYTVNQSTLLTWHTAAATAATTTTGCPNKEAFHLFVAALTNIEILV